MFSFARRASAFACRVSSKAISAPATASRAAAAVSRPPCNAARAWTAPSPVPGYIRAGRCQIPTTAITAPRPASPATAHSHRRPARRVDPLLSIMSRFYATARHQTQRRWQPVGRGRAMPVGGATVCVIGAICRRAHARLPGSARAPAMPPLADTHDGRVTCRFVAGGARRIAQQTGSGGAETCIRFTSATEIICR